VNKTICTLSEQNTLMYIKCIPLNGKLLITHYWMNSLFESVNMYTYRIMHVTRRITVIDVCMYTLNILDILNLLLLLNISSLCVWNVAHNHVKQFCILTFTTCVYLVNLVCLDCETYYLTLWQLHCPTLTVDNIWCLT